jgi:hypothetical protein
MADYARINARPVQVTRYRANVTVVTHNADGSDTIDYAQCEHDHETPGAAERCAREIGYRHAKDVR